MLSQALTPILCRTLPNVILASQMRLGQRRILEIREGEGGFGFGRWGQERHQTVRNIPPYSFETQAIFAHKTAIKALFFASKMTYSQAVQS